MRQSEVEASGTYALDHPIAEIVGTAGRTYAVSWKPFTRMRIPCPAPMWLVIGTRPVTVTSAVLNALVWKE